MIEESLASLRERVEREFRVPAESVRIVRSPYRICPLGAHIDHQLGKVTALALDRAVHLAFAPIDEPRICLRSTSYPDVVEVAFDPVEPKIAGCWGNYARGAVAALRREHHLPRGFVGIISGGLSEGGLSSSAAVGVAYLTALEHVNGLNLTPWERIEADRAIENDYLGLKNGLLDQAAIILSHRDHMTVIDCAERSHTHVPLPAEAPACAWIIAFSGIRQSLVTTGYNQRVQECAEAARLLLAAAGRQTENPLLGKVSPAEYSAHSNVLTGDLAKRARHFFSESARVEQGVARWRAGDLVSFGKLMSDSGRSSIENYECGSPPLIDLYEILCSTPGVLGARFSGAGFRGCSIGLVEAAKAESAADEVRSRYAAAHPDLSKDAPVFVCHSADGAAIL